MGMVPPDGQKFGQQLLQGSPQLDLAEQGDSEQDGQQRTG
jgi:hypothetical protein